MPQPSSPDRQQAHDLVDRIHPQHLAAAIAMLRGLAETVPWAPERGTPQDDTDFWPEQALPRSRPGPERHAAAHPSR